jgi:integrase
MNHLANRTGSIHRLDPKKINPLKDGSHYKDGTHSDGGGLYLQVRGTARSWLYRRKSGSTMGLGATHTVDIYRAREKARECRELEQDGIDPLHARKKARLDAKLQAAKDKTFRECTAEWVESNSRMWKPTTLKPVMPRFEKHIFPLIGDMPISRFDMRSSNHSAVDLIKTVLTHPQEDRDGQQLWFSKCRLASFLQQYMEGVLDWALASNYIGGANAASMKKDSPLRTLLRPIDGRDGFYVTTDSPSLPWEQMPRFMAALRAYTWTRDKFTPWSRPRRLSLVRNDYCKICEHPTRAEIEAALRAGVSDRKIAARFEITRTSVRSHSRHIDQKEVSEIRPVAALVIELIALTGVRKDQANKARWDEIDLENGIWKCEEHKTRKKKIAKGGKEVLTGMAHIIVLSRQAIAVFRYMQELQAAEGIDSEFAFHSQKEGCGRGPIADTTVNSFLKKSFLGKRKAFESDHFTIHGFRRTFKTWAVEHGYPEIDSEMALAHVIGNPVREIYARDAKRIEPRRLMMQAYADHCDRVEPAPADVIPFRQAKQA